MRKVIIEKLSLFLFFLVHLHDKFLFSRPLAVIGAYIFPDRKMIFHQMTLDRIEKDEYVLQNTKLSMDASVLRIKTTNSYYVTEDVIRNFSGLGKQPSYNVGGIFMDLVNETFGNMDIQKWYLLPEAYSLSLSLV